MCTPNTKMGSSNKVVKCREREQAKLYKSNGGVENTDGDEVMIFATLPYVIHPSHQPLGQHYPVISFPEIEHENTTKDPQMDVQGAGWFMELFLSPRHK